MLKIMLIGAPGAGKGTFAAKIKAIVPNIAHISTGDLFRANIKNNTPIGKKAKEYIDGGKLVPDEVVVGMVKNRLAEEDAQKHGFILDGFPRTENQAIELDKITNLTHVLNIEIDREILKKRILGRRTCSECKKIYNIYSDELKPEKEGICDACGGELTQRDDDNEETFAKRWETFKENTEPVLGHYQKKEGLVKPIDGTKTMSYSEDEIKELLDLA